MILHSAHRGLQAVRFLEPEVHGPLGQGRRDVRADVGLRSKDLPEPDAMLAEPTGNAALIPIVWNGHGYSTHRLATGPRSLAVALELLGYPGRRRSTATFSPVQGMGSQDPHLRSSPSGDGAY